MRSAVFALAFAAAAEAFAPASLAGAPQLRTSRTGLCMTAAKPAEGAPAAAPAKAAAPAAAQALPNGWSEAKDPSTGNTYYYNEAGETTWERPVAEKTFEFKSGKNKKYATTKLEGTQDTPYAKAKKPWDL